MSDKVTCPRCQSTRTTYVRETSAYELRRCYECAEAGVDSFYTVAK